MDTDPSLARIIFDLPRRDVPDLLAHLGGFALEHDIVIDVSDASATVDQPSLSLEKPAYNTKLVRFVQVEGEEELVPVVTRNLLDEFAIARGLKGIGKRLIYQLNDAVHEDPALKKMLTGHDGTLGYIVAGIRVDHIRELQHLWEDGNLRTRKVGPKSIAVLKDYCSELFPEDTTTPRE